MPSPAGPPRAPGLTFSPSTFVAFDLFRCPRQLRHNMRLASVKRPQGHTDPADAPPSMAKLTTRRGEQFERDLIDALRAPAQRPAQLAYVDEVFTCPSRLPPAAGATAPPTELHGNAVLADCIRRAVKEGRTLLLDQLVLFPPPELLSSLLQSNGSAGTASDATAPRLKLGAMKPDVLILRPVPSPDGGAVTTVRVTVADIKSSSHVKRGHRLQVAYYAIVLKALLTNSAGVPGVAMQFDTHGEVWLDAAAADAVTLEATAPEDHVRCCDGAASFVRERFPLESVEQDVFDFFQLVIPLATATQTPRSAGAPRDIEDLAGADASPWLLRQACSNCDVLPTCLAAATASDDAASLLSDNGETPPWAQTWFDANQGTVLDGVPLRPPPPQATRRHVARVAKALELPSLLASATATGPMTWTATPNHNPSPGQVAIGALTVNDADVLTAHGGRVATVALTPSPTRGKAFEVAAVLLPDSATPQMVSCPDDLVASLRHAAAVVVWNRAQRELLRRALLDAATVTRPPPTVSAVAGANDLDGLAAGMATLSVADGPLSSSTQLAQRLFARFFDGVVARTDFPPAGAHQRPTGDGAPAALRPNVLSLREAAAAACRFPRPTPFLTVADVTAALSGSPAPGLTLSLEDSILVAVRSTAATERQRGAKTVGELLLAIRNGMRQLASVHQQRGTLRTVPGAIVCEEPTTVGTPESLSPSVDPCALQHRFTCATAGATLTETRVGRGLSVDGPGGGIGPIALTTHPLADDGPALRRYRVLPPLSLSRQLRMALQVLVPVGWGMNGAATDSADPQPDPATTSESDGGLTASERRRFVTVAWPDWATLAEGELRQAAGDQDPYRKWRARAIAATVNGKQAVLDGATFNKGSKHWQLQKEPRSPRLDYYKPLSNMLSGFRAGNYLAATSMAALDTFDDAANYRSHSSRATREVPILPRSRLHPTREKGLSLPVLLR